ncbi:MAG: hypothetical protein MI739_08295, partial [Bacteroidales bacterium]|nr:hypothetical protein [Bacteroidales bacterium]
IISAIIGYYSTKKWLNQFAYQTPYPYLQITIILISIYILVIGLIYLKVRKTTNLNPSEILKYE